MKYTNRQASKDRIYESFRRMSPDARQEALRLLEEMAERIRLSRIKNGRPTSY